jgi:hypothetical protein
MTDFNQDIKNFQNYGTYNYQFDVAGNEILNPSSSMFQQVHISMPLANFNYDQTRILSYYDPTFTEFVRPITASVDNSVSSQDLQDQLLLAQDQNVQLTSQLSELIAVSQQTSTAASDQLIKDTIISLRISLGQGKIPEDFVPDFPYLPLPLDQQPSQQQASQ